MSKEIDKEISELVESINYKIEQPSNITVDNKKRSDKGAVDTSQTQKYFKGSNELISQLDTIKAKINLCQQSLIDQESGTTLSTEQILEANQAIKMEITTALTMWEQLHRTLLSALKTPIVGEVSAIRGDFEDNEDLQEQRIFNEVNELLDELTWEAYTGPKESDLTQLNEEIVAEGVPIAVDVANSDGSPPIPPPLPVKIPGTLANPSKLTRKQRLELKKVKLCWLTNT